MKDKQYKKNTTESTENLIVLKKQKTQRTQRKRKKTAYSVDKNFGLGSVGSAFYEIEEEK